MEILFQIIKIYTLSRCTYKDFTQSPLITFDLDKPSDTQQVLQKKKQLMDKKTRKSGLNPPIELSNSNIYTLQENILLHWASSHITHSNSFKRVQTYEDEYGNIIEKNDSIDNNDKAAADDIRLLNIEVDFKDISVFCQLIHSYKPEYAATGGPLFGYSTNSQGKAQSNYNKLNESLNKTNLNYNMSLEEMTCSSRTLLLFLMHLYLNLPSLLPKATIEFQGNYSYKST